MKVIVANNTVTALSKEFIGKEDELAEKLGFTDYEIVNAENAPDFTTEEEKILAKIKQLEAEVTQRRLREAVLTAAGKAWLDAQEKAIEVERNKLTT